MEDKRKIFSGAGFYTVLAVCVLAAAVGGYCLLSAEEPAAPTAAETSIPAPEVPEERTTTAVAPVQMASEEPEETPEEEVTPELPVVQPAADDTPVVAEVPKLVVAPLKGDVAAAFSMDALVYDETMQDWRTHDGVDIAAAEGTAVLAASSGIVSAIEENPLMGTTVVVDQDDGYQTTYANLQTGLVVSQGDRVSAGQTLGAVGQTAAAESAQAPHLHFAVSMNGTAVDPETYLNT